MFWPRHVFNIILLALHLVHQLFFAALQKVFFQLVLERPGQADFKLVATWASCKAVGVTRLQPPFIDVFKSLVDAMVYII